MSKSIQTSIDAGDDVSEDYQDDYIDESSIPAPAVTTANEIQRVLRGLGNADDAVHSQRFFKTGKGEYGEGDRFLGIRTR